MCSTTSRTLRFVWVIDSPNEFINVGTGWCLSSNFGSGGTGSVYTKPCSGSIYHNWLLS